MPKNIPVVMSSLELSVIAHTIVWLFVKRRRKLDYRTLHHITESGMMPSADGESLEAERVFAKLLRLSVAQRRRAVPVDSEDYTATRLFMELPPRVSLCQTLKLCEEYCDNTHVLYDYASESTWIVVSGVIRALRWEIVESLPAYRDAPSRLPDDGNIQPVRVSPDLRAVW